MLELQQRRSGEVFSATAGHTFLVSGLVPAVHENFLRYSMPSGRMCFCWQYLQFAGGPFGWAIPSTRKQVSCGKREKFDYLSGFRDGSVDFGEGNCG